MPERCKDSARRVVHVLQQACESAEHVGAYMEHLILLRERSWRLSLRVARDGLDLR